MKRIILVSLFLSFFDFNSAFASWESSKDNLPQTVPWEWNNTVYTHIAMYNYLPDYVLIAVYCPAATSITIDYNYGALAMRSTADYTCRVFESDDNDVTWLTNHWPFTYARNNQTPTSNLGDFIRANKDVTATYTENWYGAWGFNLVTAGDKLINGSSFGGFVATKQLHISRSPELGGGVSDYPTGENILCGIDSYEICQASFPLNTQVTLDASPNEGYEFSHWEINDLAMADVDGSIPVTMSENKDVIAVFVPVLKFPLSGTLESRELAHFFFSDTWDCAQCGQCPTGTYKLHVGADLSATYNYQNEVGERVDAAHAGVVKKIFTDQHLTWADAIVIESDDGQFTTVYWHVIKYGNLAENDPVTKGQQIATIADLGDNTHFHFGIRMAPYSYPESLAGALPVADGCGYLAFPEKFIDPKAAIYE